MDKVKGTYSEEGMCFVKCPFRHNVRVGSGGCRNCPYCHGEKEISTTESIIYCDYRNKRKDYSGDFLNYFQIIK